MNKLICFFNLIRTKNLLIIILTQVLIKYFLINSYLSTSALSNTNFIIYLFALLSIVAAGYIINDIYDIETDKINKPKTRIIEKEISKKTALKIYYTLNLIGIFSGFYTAMQIQKISFGFIFVFFFLSLLQYSRIYKKSFLIGNLQIALLISLSIINIAIFDLVPNKISHQNGSNIIFNIIVFYAAFSFIMTLIREIIKDMQDVKGDNAINAHTLAIKYGRSKTKKITQCLVFIPIIGIALIQYFQLKNLIKSFAINSSLESLIAIFYILLIQTSLIILVIKINKSNTTSDFHSTSKLCKIIIVIGILSIPVFNYLQVN